MTVSNGHVPARRRGDQQVQLPFKGESFPNYVVHRPPPTRLATSKEREAAHEPAEVTVPPQTMLASYYPPRDASTATAARATPSLLGSPPVCTPLAARKLSTTQQSLVVRYPRASQRPSLADQLKAISQGVQDVTTRLKATYRLPGGAGSESTLAARTATASSVGVGGFQATTISMTVGRLACRFPCPAMFAPDHCAYLFQHPFEAKEVQMVMYYRDMVDVNVVPRDKTFRFRVDHSLHQFGNDYNPSNPQHWIKIVFATTIDTDRVKEFVTHRRRSFSVGTE